MRNSPPRKHTITPIQRIASPSSVKNPTRSVYDEEESHQQRNHAEGPEHPAIAAVLLLARTQAAARRHCERGKHNRYGGERSKGRMPKERHPPAPAGDRQPELDNDRDNPGDQNLNATHLFLFAGLHPQLITGAAPHPCRYGDFADESSIDC